MNVLLTTSTWGAVLVFTIFSYIHNWQVIKTLYREAQKVFLQASSLNKNLVLLLLLLSILIPLVSFVLLIKDIGYYLECYTTNSSFMCSALTIQCK